MKSITRNARQCTEATNVGFAQNSHWCATVRPGSFGARVAQPSLALLFRSAVAGRSSVLRLIEKRSGGSRLKCNQARRLRAKTHQSGTSGNRGAARNAVRSGT